MHPLLDQKEIGAEPFKYLTRVGEVFAEFGAKTQDSGNVSYGVLVGDKRFFVKTAGYVTDSKPFLSHTERVALLRNAVRLARSCSHPALPKLYRVIESPAGPMLVYEWLDGELLGAKRDLRDDPRSSYQRFRRLPAERIQECLDVVFNLHRELVRLGWIAVDFYDGCMIYDFSSGRLGIVDLDMYKDAPFINEMGRMFGSSRFMAPEEFRRGDLIDERTTVFTMGRTIAVFLSDGTTERACFRGSDELFEVMCKACQRDREKRFQSMEEFHEAWVKARTK